MEEYEVMGAVGKGAFGAVQKIRRLKDGKVCIWKEIAYGSMTEQERKQLVTEVAILKQLRHPHIVRYLDRVVDREQAKVYIVMEYCEGGDLAQLVRKERKTGRYLPEDLIWSIFSQISQALYACHSHSPKILHRDLKSSNVFLTPDLTIKLGDFGLSRLLGDQSDYAYTRVGTPYYMSPELVNGEKYDERSDIWSLGCLLFEITALNPPFQAKTQAELSSKIRSGLVAIPEGASLELRRVIKWLLTVNTARRPDISDVLNVPQVAMRVRNRKMKEMQGEIKRKMREIGEREEEMRKREEDLKRKEEEIRNREIKVEEREKCADAPQRLTTPPTHPRPPFKPISRPLPSRGRLTVTPPANTRRIASASPTAAPLRPNTTAAVATAKPNLEAIDRYIREYKERPQSAKAK
jgi:NIMA (never in mitosis gene a)-related kinase